MLLLLSLAQLTLAQPLDAKKAQPAKASKAGARDAGKVDTKSASGDAQVEAEAASLKTFSASRAAELVAKAKSLMASTTPTMSLPKGAPISFKSTNHDIRSCVVGPGDEIIYVTENEDFGVKLSKLGQHTLIVEQRTGLTTKATLMADAGTPPSSESKDETTPMLTFKLK